LKGKAILREWTRKGPGAGGASQHVARRQVPLSLADAVTLAQTFNANDDVRHARSQESEVRSKEPETFNCELSTVDCFSNNAVDGPFHVSEEDDSANQRNETLP
jgi:hypothetical protein